MIRKYSAYLVLYLGHALSLWSKENGVWPRGPKMRAAYTYREDGGSVTRGACFCKAGNVLKVTVVWINSGCWSYCVAINFMHSPLFRRHPVMAKWPVGHSWFFMKLELIQVWLQDWVGGVSLIPLEDYFKATPFWVSVLLFDCICVIIERTTKSFMNVCR